MGSLRVPVGNAWLQPLDKAMMRQTVPVKAALRVSKQAAEIRAG
jgi:hypothetical protein